jgi:hypothetical protein
MIADDLHHPPAVERVQRMDGPAAIRDDDFHATPSFFCNDVEDVVY